MVFTLSWRQKTKAKNKPVYQNCTQEVSVTYRDEVEAEDKNCEDDR